MKPILPRLYSKISSLWYRHRLHNDNFTIIANTCIAGVMYHKLGKQFLTPMINIWIYDEDFFRFVKNLDYYMAQPLKFVKCGESYPTAYCGDIMLYFVHYHTDEEAETKWEERKKRINKDNLFIICSDRPHTRSITYEDIASLKDVPCKGKAVFSTQHYDDIDYIIPYRKAPDGDFVAVYMNDRTKHFRQWYFEKIWDWVHWLNTGEVKLRRCMV